MLARGSSCLAGSKMSLTEPFLPLLLLLLAHLQLWL